MLRRGISLVCQLATIRNKIRQILFHASPFHLYASEDSKICISSFLFPRPLSSFLPLALTTVRIKDLDKLNLVQVAYGGYVLRSSCLKK